MADTKAFGMAAEKGRWLFVIIGLTMNLCLGSVYSYGVFKPHVEFEFNKKKAAEAGLVVDNIDKDLLKGIITLKKDAAEKFYPAAKTITAQQVTEIFKLKPEKDQEKIEKFTKLIPAMADKDLELLKGLKKVSSLEGNLPFMTFLAFFSLLMFFGGKIMEKLGPRKLALVGSVIVGLGWGLSYFAQNIYMLVLTYGVIAGSGVGLAYGCPVSLGARWFPDKKGLAVGLMLAGFGGSALLTANIAGALIPKVGLFTTFLYFGIAFAIILVVLSLPYHFPEAGWKPAGWTAAAGAAAVKDFTSGEMAKTGSFWGLFLAYIIGCLAGLMAIGISAPVGQEIIKVTAEQAAMFTGIFAIFNAVGRPLFGTLTDKITPKWAGVLNMAIILAVSLVMLKAGEGSVIMYVGAFCGFWLCLGGWLAIAPAATASFFGMKNYARNYGVVFFAYGLGAIIGGLISGFAKDLFGSFSVAFYPTAGLAVLGIILCVALLKQPQK
ncbi:MAG TPA: OFA family MFS transporter [Spirochaetota bacterium]|nr:OFA family MFS transporter [Spirochaetota bacterium]HPV42904.1 OFA family MFS transporter [Spirochaetota bacterium]